VHRDVPNEMPEEEPDRRSCVTLREGLAVVRAPSQAPPPGELVDQTFRILGPLGRGGMAEVHLALDMLLDRRVALKFLGSHLTRSPTWRARFVAEARAMARLRHEHVVQVYSFGVFERCPYFAMEYVAGRTLRERLDAGPVDDPAEAIALLAAIADGLDAIHDTGLVHHDIKPSNVLLDDAGRVLVSDFGLSRLVGAASSGAFAGTPSRAAPEQCDRNPLPPELATRTDVYQLGVLAFELLTGALPFQSDSAQGVLMMHCTHPCPRPGAVAPRLGTAFDEPILAALAKNPAERQARASALVQQLTAGLRHAAPPMRILVADDEPELLAATCSVLTSELPQGAIVERAADGIAALAAAERERFDVVLLDLQMPGMSGLEVAAAIQGTRSAERPCVVLMTAVGGPNEWRVGHELGVDAFLVKPLDPDLLVATIEKWGARRASSMPPSSRATPSTRPR
jgi:eukaryotic-like serine/threonine-protein kinase